jgi:hypothetical protein
VKFVPLSAIMTLGLGLTAKNRSTARRNDNVSIVSIISKWTAPTVLHRNINCQRLTSDLLTLVLKGPATSTAVKLNGCNLADGWRKNGSGAMICFVGLACLFLQGIQLYAIFLNKVLDLGTKNFVFISVVPLIQVNLPS